jgi:hypothetical protein
VTLTFAADAGWNVNTIVSAHISAITVFLFIFPSEMPFISLSSVPVAEYHPAFNLYCHDIFPVCFVKE